MDLYNELSLAIFLFSILVNTQLLNLMKQLVIFDLDGTLLDTVADLANATNQALHANEC